MASWRHCVDLLADSRQPGRCLSESPSTSPQSHPPLCNLRPQDKSQQNSDTGPGKASEQPLGHHEESQQRSHQSESWDTDTEDTPGKEASLCLFGAGWLQVHRELWLWGSPVRNSSVLNPIPLSAHGVPAVSRVWRWSSVVSPAEGAQEGRSREREQTGQNARCWHGWTVKMSLSKCLRRERTHIACLLPVLMWVSPAWEDRPASAV